MAGEFYETRYSALKLLAVVLVVASMICTACVTDSSRAETTEDRVLRIGFMQKADSLNPFVGLTDASRVFYGLVYDCLQAVDENLGSAPNIALGWGIDGDYEPYGSVWGFNLTENARWHDGTPVTADDVVFTVNLNADYYTQMWAYQPYTYFMDYAEKVDDNTVRIHFYDRATEEPMPVAYGSSLYFPIMPSHMLDEMSPSDIGFSWSGMFDDSDPPIVGTGPFMATENIYEEYLQGDKLTLVRNPNYHWAQDRSMEIQFDKLEMRFFDDATVMALALEIGAVDVAQFPPRGYVKLKSKISSGELEDIYAYDGPKCNQYWTEVLINMNNAGPNPSRLDPVIRQAMAMATDKTYIVDNFYLGLAEEGSTLIPPVNTEWHYELTDDEIYHFDLAAANALLEEEGYRYTAESPTVRVCTADSYAVTENLVEEGTLLVYGMAIRQEYPEERDIALYLESEWAKIGIEIEYEIMTEGALGARVYSYSYDTAIWYWSSDPDPNYILFCQSKYAWAGWNDNLYSTPEYEENYTGSVQAMDYQRNSFVDNCQRIHYLDASYVILACPYQTCAWRTDTFTGWGDWSKNPGRSIDACWGGNPLYFDLEYIGEIDDDPPVSSASISGTQGGNGWYTSSVYLAIEADDGFGEGVLSTTYRLDDGPWSPYSMLVEVSGDGIHSVEFFSIDLVGNVENVQTLEIKIDCSEPTILIDVEDGVVFAVNQLNISWESSDTGSGVDLVEYSVDGEVYTTCDDDYVILSDMGDGEHSFGIRVHDTAGNNASDTLQFEVDTSTSGISGLTLMIGIATAVVIGVAALALGAMLVLRRKQPSPPGDTGEPPPEEG